MFVGRSVEHANDDDFGLGFRFGCELAFGLGCGMVCVVIHGNLPILPTKECVSIQREEMKAPKKRRTKMKMTVFVEFEIALK